MSALGKMFTNVVAGSIAIGCGMALGGAMAAVISRWTIEAKLDDAEINELLRQAKERMKNDKFCDKNM